MIVFILNKNYSEYIIQNYYTKFYYITKLWFSSFPFVIYMIIQARWKSIMEKKIVLGQSHFCIELYNLQLGLMNALLLQQLRYCCNSIQIIIGLSNSQKHTNIHELDKSHPNNNKFYVWIPKMKYWRSKFWFTQKCLILSIFKHFFLHSIKALFFQGTLVVFLQLNFYLLIGILESIPVKDFHLARLHSHFRKNNHQNLDLLICLKYASDSSKNLKKSKEVAKSDFFMNYIWKVSNNTKH